MNRKRLAKYLAEYLGTDHEYILELLKQCDKEQNKDNIASEIDEILPHDLFCDDWHGVGYSCSSCDKEKIAKQNIKSLIDKRCLETRQQMKANIFTQFKVAMTKQELSPPPQNGTRFRTPLEELALILENEAPLSELSELTSQKEKM